MIIDIERGMNDYLCIFCMLGFTFYKNVDIYDLLVFFFCKMHPKQ